MTKISFSYLLDFAATLVVKNKHSQIVYTFLIVFQQVIAYRVVCFFTMWLVNVQPEVDDKTYIHLQ